MEQQIPETVAQVLDVLGEKFGATGAHLWEVMVRQQVIEGWISLIGVPIAIIAVSIITQWGWAQIQEERKKSYGDDFPYLMVGTVLLVFAMFAIGAGMNKALAVFNPEYYALKEVLRAVR